MRQFLKSTLPLLCAGLLAGAGIEAPEPEANEFHFVVLGDSQFDFPEQFNRVVDQTRRLRPAFVIQVGDLIEGYNSNLDEIRAEWRRFGRQVEPLAPVPFFAVPGNHDVFGGGKRPDAALEGLFEQTWGPLYFHFTYKNASFIGLNSDSAEAMNAIAGEQLQWLRKTLRENKSEHTFVFLHRPPLLLKNADELHALFVEHKVTHVFYGHHHHYHHFVKDGVPYTMTNAAAESAHDSDAVGSFHHLLQVAVRGAEVDVAVIEADAIKAQDAVFANDNYDMFELTRNLAPRRVDLEPRQAAHRYSLRIPLRNATQRDIEVFVACHSGDERWSFAPRAIAPIALAAGGKRNLDIEARFSAERIPESSPECSLRVPFQTRDGGWIDFEQTIQTRGFKAPE